MQSRTNVRRISRPQASSGATINALQRRGARSTTLWRLLGDTLAFHREAGPSRQAGFRTDVEPALAGSRLYEGEPGLAVTHASRALEPPNQQDVAALVAEVSTINSAGLYPPESRFPVAIETLAQPNVLFAVARDRNGKAIGCGAVVSRAEFGEIKRMFVRPGERGQGVGKAMLLFLEAKAARTGCTLLRLETGVKQTEALALYEHCGFKRRGPFASYPDDPLCVFIGIV